MLQRHRSRLVPSVLALVLLLVPARLFASGPPAPEASRYGVNVDYLSSAGAPLEQARAAGFGWVYYVLYWNLVNPRHDDCNGDSVVDASDLCNFDWLHADDDIQRMADLGLNVYVRIAFPPAWTTGATSPNEHAFYCYAPPPDPDGVRDDDEANCNNPERRPGFRAAYSPDAYPAGYDRSGDFRQFVDIVVRRYKDRVKAWGFGTEMHNRVFWQGTATQFFDEILKPGHDTVKAIDPTLLVVGPDEDQLASFEYLVGLEATRGRAFDVLSFHVLQHSRWLNTCDVNERIRPSVQLLRQGRAFWLTELGYWSDGSEHADSAASWWLKEMLTGIAGTRPVECTQEEPYRNQAWQQLEQPWVDKAFVYSLRDGGPPDFGLFTSDNQPRPTFTEVSKFLAEQQPPRKYYLAEGATKSFFNLDIAIANPNASDAPTKVSFMKPDGSVVLETRTLAPKSRITLHVDSIPGLESADVSTVVESTSGVPLAVERSMFWDSTYYAGHTDTAVQAPATRWYFAEGAQGFFDTYVLMANSNIAAAHVNVTFLLEGSAPVVEQFTVGATARAGFCACQFTELVNKSFGIVVESDLPIIAERSMYFGSSPFWTGGHESAGVTAPSTTWFLAEGHTGPFFDEWVLISNPNPDPTHVDVTFFTSDSRIVPFLAGPAADGVIPGQQRFSIYVDAVAGLEDVAVATKVQADLPVVVERAMYWPGGADRWYEAHNSFGMTESGTRWVLAEGRHGTSRQFESYILLYNTSDAPANVKVTYLLNGEPSFSVDYTGNRAVAPSSRMDIVDWVTDTRLANREYGALIESDQPIAVERAMYWTGQALRPWGYGGSNATGIKLQ